MAAFNYETVCYYGCHRVRVAPFTRTVAAFNYENRSRAVYNYENRSRPAWNYDTRSRAVFNYDTRSRAVFNYDTRSRAVFNYDTRSRAVFNYENRSRPAWNYDTRSRAVFNYDTRSRAVYNYDTRSRAVFNYDTRSRAVFNYDTRSRAVFNYDTRSRAVYNYENRTRDVSHTHTCPAGQQLQGHDTCVVVPPPQCTPSAGEHRHTVANLNRVFCHADHTCPAGQRLVGHDTCVVVPPPPCTPSAGEHRHTVTNLNRVYCHADHTCPAGQQLQGHDTCVVLPPPPCTPSAGEHRHTVTNLNRVYCHADHTCPAGQRLVGHDTCVVIPPPPCTPSAGEHQHTVTNLNRVYCHADHTCSAGQHLSGHDTCHDDHTCPAGQHLSGHDDCEADHTCSAGQHLHGHDDCEADHTCSAGQRLVGHDTCVVLPPPPCTPSAGEHQHTVTNLNRVYCHADHTCPAGQRLVGHDTCVVLPPPPCTPSAGEHQHTVTNLNRVYCHADHTCPAGQHLGGHDTCHDDHTCPPSQRLQGHEDCVPIPPPVICDSSEHRHSTLGNNSYCHADHTCDTGQHLGGHETCHADHTCPAGQRLVGHDTCVAVPPPPCTPSAGEHKHTVTNLNQVYCHADHTCDTGQHLSGHDDCDVDHICDSGQHLSGHDTCHDDHTCPAGQRLQGHDTCVAIPPVSGSLPTISGLRCSAASSGSLTVTWDRAAGAASYEVQASALSSAPLLAPWDAAGTRSGDMYTHTFSSLGTGQVFTLAVRGVNSQDATGPAATVKCSTASRDMLTLECNANALLVAEFSDPYADTGITPTNYTVRITKAGDTQSTTRQTQQDMLVYTDAEYEGQYTVTLIASHETGWARYKETDTVTCPAHTDNWNSPNFYDPSEDCNDDTALVGWLVNYFCRQGANQLELAEAYQELSGLKPALIEVEPVLLSRSCQINEAQTERTCRETWSENIILLKNPGIDWRALPITDWSGPREVLQNTGTLLTVAGLVVATALAPPVGVAFYITLAGTGVATADNVVGYWQDAAEKEFIQLFPVKAAAVAAAGTSLDVQGIANFQGCLSGYDFSPQTETINDSHTYGTLTDIRITTNHYCLPD